MASTAMKTVEGHQGATRPNCTPAPGAHRALACVVLAAGFVLAVARLAQYFAGPGFALLALPFLALLFLPQPAPTRCTLPIDPRQDGHLAIAASRSGTEARPGLRLARARCKRRGKHLMTPRKHRRLASDPTRRPQQQAR